jgi:hypothetical protein
MDKEEINQWRRRRRKRRLKKEASLYLYVFIAVVLSFFLRFAVISPFLGCFSAS